MVVTELYHRALPLYFRELSIPVELLGVGLSVANALEVVASPVAGAAADEFDRFGVAALAAVAVAVALFGFSAVGGLPAVFFFDAFDEDVAGRAWGIDGMTSKAAGIAAPTAGSLLYARVPAAPFLAGAVLLVAATAVATTIPRH